MNDTEKALSNLYIILTFLTLTILMGVYFVWQK